MGTRTSIESILIVRRRIWGLEQHRKYHVIRRRYGDKNNNIESIMIVIWGQEQYRKYHDSTEKVKNNI